MSPQTKEQLEAIHAMLERGHRSVRLERHTFVLWGLTTAILILVTTPLFSAERFPEVWQRSAAANFFIAVVLTIVGVWDFRLTRRVRRERDESISFVQRQLTKVWWLLVGLIVLINLGMNFFGGGYMFYGVVLAVIGLAFYIYGLFSQQLLTWVGVSMIAMGLASVALGLPFALMEWLAVFVFGLGLPVLGWVIGSQTVVATALRRFASLGAWLVLVIVPTIAMSAYTARPVSDETPVTALAEYRASGEAVAPALQIVRLPAGAEIPLRVDVKADILQGTLADTIIMQLTRDVDIVLRQGKPDGHFRIDGRQWGRWPYDLRIRLEIDGALTPERGAHTTAKLRVLTEN